MCKAIAICSSCHGKPGDRRYLIVPGVRSGRIYVVDANYLNRGELLLGHRHEGSDLKLDYARDTLRNLERIWRRPTAILTVVDDKPKRIRYDGSEVTISDEPEAFKV